MPDSDLTEREARTAAAIAAANEDDPDRIEVDGESRPLQQSLGSLPCLFTPNPLVEGHFQHVVQHRPGRIQCRILEDEAENLRAQVRPFGITGERRVKAFHKDLSRLRAQHQSQQVEQRALTLTGATHHRGH